MKYLLLFLFPLHGALAAGENFSIAIQQEIDARFASSLVQLTIPNTCPKLIGDENLLQLQETVFRKPNLQKDAESFRGMGSILAMPTAALVIANAATISLHKQLPPLALTGSMAGSGYLAYSAFNLAAQKDAEHNSKQNKEFILNVDALNAYAEVVGKYMANLFQLSIDERSSFVASIKNDIRQKIKNQDETPFNYFSALKNATFRGKPLVSEEKLGVLNQLASLPQEKISAASPNSQEQKIEAIALSNKFFKSCAASGDLANSRKIDLKLAIARNEALLDQISDFKTLKRLSVPSSSQEEKSSLNVE